MEGILDGREELLDASVDFTRIDEVNEDDAAAVCPCGTPGPDVPPECTNILALPEEDR